MDSLLKALEDIRDIAKSWEGRKEAPYWNLGDKAASALKKHRRGIKEEGMMKCGEMVIRDEEVVCWI